MAERLGRFVYFEPGASWAPRDRALLILSGIINSGRIHSQEQREALGGWGGVYFVENPTDDLPAYPEKDIVAEVADHLFRYPEICVIGISMGALQVGDISDELRGRGYEGEIKAILPNPACRLGVKWLPWRAFPPFIGWLQPYEEGVPGSPNLTEHVEYMNALKGGKVWRQQFMWLLRHPLPRRGQYSDIEAVVIPSRWTDPLLFRWSAWFFNRAYNTVHVETVTSWHGDLVEQPKLWRCALLRFLRILYPEG